MNEYDGLQLDEAVRAIVNKDIAGHTLNGVEKMALMYASLMGLAVAIKDVNTDSPNILASHAIDKWKENESTCDDCVSLLNNIQGILINKNYDWVSDFRSIKSEEVSRGVVKNKKEQLTYIIQCTATNLIKIGRSYSPAKRIKSIRSSSGRDLLTLLILDKDVESELHKRFSKYRRSGEWFEDVDGDIKRYISNVNDGIFL